MLVLRYFGYLRRGEIRMRILVVEDEEAIGELIKIHAGQEHEFEFAE